MDWWTFLGKFGSRDFAVLLGSSRYIIPYHKTVLMMILVPDR